MERGNMYGDMQTEQKVVTCHAQGRHTSIDSAVKSAASALEAKLAEMRRDVLMPEIVSVSHSSGYVGHTGFFANIVAIVTVRVPPFARR
jgi:hypothetical protein